MLSKNTTNINYYFLGGTAFELIGHTLKNPKLRHFTDPTADIDIQVFPPKIEPVNPDEKDKFGEIYYPENAIFYNHFTSWIVEKLQYILEKDVDFLEKSKYILFFTTII